MDTVIESKASTKTTNMPLRKMALAIARQYQHDGAILITKSADGYHIGVSGLTDQEVQEALCVGIHHNILMLDAQGDA